MNPQKEEQVLFAPEKLTHQLDTKKDLECSPNMNFKDTSSCNSNQKQQMGIVGIIITIDHEVHALLMSHVVAEESIHIKKLLAGRCRWLES